MRRLALLPHTKKVLGLNPLPGLGLSLWQTNCPGQILYPTSQLHDNQDRLQPHHNPENDKYGWMDGWSIHFNAYVQNVGEYTHTERNI